MLNNLGDGSTLSLDFTTGVLDSRLTFSRASGGTYVGNDGFVYGVDFATSSSLAIGTGSKSVTLTATAGQSRRYEIGQTVYIANGANNMSGAVTAYSSATQVLTINATSTSGSGSFTSWVVGNASARFDYDPTTLAPRGLLIEGSATNLSLRSGDFNTTVTDGTQWIASGYTAGTLSTTLPDGTTGDARRISFASGSGSFRSSTITVTASTAYTFSFWARNNGGSQARFRVWNVTAGSSIVDYTQSVNNYVSQIGGANNTSSTWVRVSVQFTTPAGCTSIWVYPSSSDSGTVDLLVWGAQVELGSGASSYIPTGASTGFRAADSCVMTGTNFSSWFAGATEGVLYTQFEKPRSQSGNVAHDFAAVGSRYNTGEGLILYVSNSTLLPTAILWATGGAVFGGGIATAIPSVTKHALKWFAVNDVTNYSNGVVGSTGNGTGTVTPAMLTIGANSASGTAATRDWLNACVRTVKFWPVALPDSQIIALTT
jgi:hypothetical protein